MWTKAALWFGLGLTGMVVATAVVPTAARPPMMKGLDTDRHVEKRERTMTFRGDAAKHLRLNLRAANVMVVAGKGDALVVRFTREVTARTTLGAQRALDSINERAEAEKGAVLVTDIWPQGETIFPKDEVVKTSLAVVIEAPRGVAIENHQRSGSVEVHGPVASANILLQTGSVNLLEQEGVRGQVVADSGTIALSGRFGNMKVITSSGSVTGLGLDASSAERLTVKTSTGVVNLGLKSLPTANLTALSGTGNVSLRLPKQAPGTVSLKSEIGGVRSDFPLQAVVALGRHAGRELSGVLLGQTRPKIEAYSTVGNVTLAQG